MRWPKISIVTPSFNQVEFIKATIDSILSQNYPNLEYTIIDGGSTDGTVELIKKYEKYLHYWCSETDNGQYEAINKGFARSTGEIMAWLNSDDLYFPWTFRTVSSIMSELPKIEWLTSLRPAFWDWHGFCIGISVMSPGHSREAFLDGCYIPSAVRTIPTIRGSYGFIQQESTFWRRSLWEKVGGYISTEFKLAADFDLWSRFYIHADLYSAESPLGGFRFQERQKTSQLDAYMAEAEKSLSIMRKSLEWSPNFARNLSFKLRLHKIPKIRKVIKERYFYIGKRVVRQKARLPTGFWDVIEYKFH